MQWPPNYVAEFARRQQLIITLRSSPEYVASAKTFYAANCKQFINDWGVTYDPRNAGNSNLPTFLPFITFPRQEEFIDFVLACLAAETDGLNEKCRDMGSTWLCVAISVWLWLFVPGAAIGWGSRKEPLVDKIGDPDSIFEKIRIFIRYLPKELLPKDFDPLNNMPFMKVLNPENGASITGEVGDNIGRGGRKLIYFVDESAWLEHPELIEAALGDNTRVRIDISSVHNLGSVFHRKRESGVEWTPGSPAIKGQINVFIMDWRDHPGKSVEWYNQRRAAAVSRGLLHVFAQEIDRDYAASVEGVIIPAEWVNAAIDAHKKLDYLGDWNTGMPCAGLDVADEGLDRNALAIRQGSVLRGIAEWGERDTGLTARRAIAACAPYAPLPIQYDSIGVGAGVKAEANRVEDEDLMPPGLRFVPWNAGARVLEGWEHVIPGDKDSPTNEAFFKNRKSQAWWSLRTRFENTYKAINEGLDYDVDDLISIPSDLPLLHSLRKELSQSTMGQSANLKLIINKKPDGAKSPNLADAVVMCFFPVPEEVSAAAVQGVQTLMRRHAEVD